MSPLFREYQERKANNFMYHMPTFMVKDLQRYDFILQTVELFNVEYEFSLKLLFTSTYKLF